MCLCIQPEIEGLVDIAEDDIHVSNADYPLEIDDIHVEPLILDLSTSNKSTKAFGAFECYNGCGRSKMESVKEMHGLDDEDSFQVTHLTNCLSTLEPLLN